MSHSLWALTLVKLITFFTLIFAVFAEKLYQIWLHYLILLRRCDQNNLIQYGHRRHVEFTSGLHFDTFQDSEDKMRPHTKFRANRSIFRQIMTIRIFSRWLPSAILNFEKFKFWINFRGRSQNLRQHTKFGQNRAIGGRDNAIKPKSNMAAAAMLNLLPVYILTHFQD